MSQLLEGAQESGVDLVLETAAVEDQVTSGMSYFNLTVDNKILECTIRCANSWSTVYGSSSLPASASD